MSGRPVQNQPDVFLVNLTRIVTLLTAVLTLTCFASSGQHAYHPFPVYTEYDAELFRQLREQHRLALRSMDRTYSASCNYIYEARKRALFESIRTGLYVKDSVTEALVGSVMKNLIKANTTIERPHRILIRKDPVPNATCYGEGTFIITAGLISSISNESQLAFILAHELAHFELDHVRDRIIQYAKTHYRVELRRQMAKILGGRDSKDDVTELRELLYAEGLANRRMEFQADSLGLLYLRNAGYSEGESMSVLTVLDSTGYLPPIGRGLFSPLHTARYPFQEHWLRERLSVYRRTFSNTLFISGDSIASHPGITPRQQRLTEMIRSIDGRVDSGREQQIAALTTSFAFEAVQSAYERKQLDRCLHLALRLWQRYPGDSYLVAMISRVLIDLYELKNTEIFSLQVPRYTWKYSSELRKVNDFLNNLTREEFGELAFNFLNSESWFDVDNEAHYYLLNRLCELMNRRELSRKVKTAYSARFSKPRFDSELY